MKTLKQWLVKDGSLNTSLWTVVFIHMILWIGVVCCLLPFFYMVTTAFKSYQEAIQIPPVWFPSLWRLDGMKELFAKIPIGIMFWNSTITTIVVVFGQVFFSALAGFSLAMIQFPYRKLVLTVCLAILMVPSQTYLIPQFLLIQKMGLTNTLTAIVLPNVVSAFGTFLFQQAFLALPKSLYEASLLDSCNPFQIFLYVMFPLVKPTVAAFGVLAALYNWNSLLWPLIVNTSQYKYPLAVGISSILGDSSVGLSYPLLMSSALIALVPMVIIFLVLKKYILDNNSYLGDK
ncbi:MAG: carbohydrate ABC transporter permease [Brevinema sp.]